MNILVDYCVISVKNKSVFSLDSLCNFLKIKITECTHDRSYYGLDGCYYYCGIKLHYGDFFIIDMSGQGCRTLETLYNHNLNWIDFINIFLQEEGSHLARLDIAGDDKPEIGEKPILSFKTMVRHVQREMYITRAKRKIYIDGDEQDIVFGSPTSDRRLRIYNKALERGYNGHWIRCEFQLRNDTALSFYIRALECGSIGQAYQGMLLHYLRFITEPNDDVHHQDRKQTTRWWLKFCGNAKKIKGFYIGGLEYNMQSLERYLAKQVSSSLNAYITVNNGDLTSLLNMVEVSKLNKKQEFLVKTEQLRKQIYLDYGVEDIDN